MIGVHEGAGAIVDGFACDRHVVGVHHAMNEADEHPFGDEVGLARNHKVQKREDGVFLASGLRVMAGYDVIRELAELPPRRRAPQRTGRCRCGRGSAPPLLAPRPEAAFRADRFPGRDRRKRSGGRDAQRRHGLAHDVFAKHRPKRRAPIAASGKGRPARPF